MDFMQKLEEVNGMLGVFSQYWPTFKIQQGQAEAWAYALKDYSREELWESIKQFSTEEERVFAPSISELIGRTDTLKEISRKKQSDLLALAPPKKSRGEYEPMEEYSYKTSRTTPKKNKEETDHEIRKAVRVSAQRRDDLAQQANTAGLRKVRFSGPNGRSYYEWVRN